MCLPYDASAQNTVDQQPKAKITVAPSPYARPDLADGYIKELRGIMRGKTYPSYQKFIITKINEKDYAILETYFATLQDAYERKLIDDIELRYAFSTLWDVYELKYDTFFEEWIQKNPKSYIARIAYANYHYRVAWAIRGDGYSNTVSDASYDMYSKELAISQKHFLEATKLSSKPTIAYFGLIGTNGETNSRLPTGQDITQLLRLANSIDPQNFWVRQQYMRFLHPSWGGSYEVMRNFVEDQKMAGLEENKLNLLKSTIFISYADAYAYDKNINAAEKLYRKAYALQQPYKFLSIGQEGVKGLIWSKNKKSTDHVYDEEMISAIDDLLYNSGNIEYAGYYHSLKGHFYVARALKNKNLEDFKSAFESFKAGANQEDAYSTFRLASTYCEGFSGIVEQNQDLCKSLMIESAEMGAEEAQSVVRNKWGMNIEKKVKEELVFGLTQAGQNLPPEDYALKQYEGEQERYPLWQQIMYVALNILL